MKKQQRKSSAKFPKDKAEKLLGNLGVRNSKGYPFLLKAIELAYNDSKVLQDINSLYSVIADKDGVTPRQVELAIKNSIEISWWRARESEIKQLLGPRSMYNRYPSADEYIAVLTAYIKMKFS